MAKAGGNTIPVLIVLAVLLLIWYFAATLMNAPWQALLYSRAGTTDVPLLQYLGDVWSQDKPILPAPHQIVQEVWANTAGQALISKRSFLYHAGITLSATLLGFVFGTVLGLALAVLILHNEAMNRSLMPWIIASQTIPILAIAPMVIRPAPVGDLGYASPATVTFAPDSPFLSDNSDFHLRPYAIFRLPASPAPRALASNSSTTSNSTCTTGTTTICAMRSPGLIVNARSPRFHIDTITGPW